MTEPPRESVHGGAPGGWATIASMYVGYATFMVRRMIPTVTGASMREDPTLDIDLAELGLIFAWGTWGAVGGKFIGGLAADWFGGKWTFTVGLLLTSVFIGLFGLSNGLGMFQAMFFLALLAKSFGWPAMAKIITKKFPTIKLDPPFDLDRDFAALVVVHIRPEPLELLFLDLAGLPRDLGVLASDRDLQYILKSGLELALVEAAALIGVQALEE